MRWSETFIPTLRQVPSDTEPISHQLLMRAGYIRKAVPGEYIYLPLMRRVLNRFKKLIRDELNAVGAVEYGLPSLLSETEKKADRDDRLAMPVSRLSGELRSYRQLPLVLYQIGKRCNSGIKPKHGLIQAREYQILELLGFAGDESSQAQMAENLRAAFTQIFKRIGLEVVAVESADGYTPDGKRTELVAITDSPVAEDVIMISDDGSYAAQLDIAEFQETGIPDNDDALLEIREVATPGASTIEDVSAFLQVSAQRLVKTLICMADGRPLAALVRGDRELNLAKLKRQVGAETLELADAEVVRRITGCPVGFAGPVGLKEIDIIADLLVMAMRNGITGANRDEMHLVNVNPGRDFSPLKSADIVNAEPGDLAPDGRSRLNSYKGILLASINQIGPEYCANREATFYDANGELKPFFLILAKMGISRVLQVVAEFHHDNKGLIWPKEIAPYRVEIIPIAITDKTIREAAELVNADLADNECECLTDDRDERPGVKFNDADLIGIPIRVIIGDRSLKQGGVEVKTRSNSENILAELGVVGGEINMIWNRIK